MNSSARTLFLTIVAVLFSFGVAHAQVDMEVRLDLRDAEGRPIEDVLVESSYQRAALWESSLKMETFKVSGKFEKSLDSSIWWQIVLVKDGFNSLTIELDPQDLLEGAVLDGGKLTYTKVLQFESSPTDLPTMREFLADLESHGERNRLITERIKLSGSKSEEITSETLALDLQETDTVRLAIRSDRLLGAPVKTVMIAGEAIDLSPRDAIVSLVLQGGSEGDGIIWAESHLEQTLRQPPISFETAPAGGYSASVSIPAEVYSSDKDSGIYLRIHGRYGKGVVSVSWQPIGKVAKVELIFLLNMKSGDRDVRHDPG